MDKLDKEIMTRLYDEINEETTENDMVKILKRNPVRFFDQNKFKLTNRIIRALNEGIKDKDNLDRFMTKYNTKDILNFKLLELMIQNECDFKRLNKDGISIDLILKAIEIDAKNYLYLNDVYQQDKQIIYTTIVSDPHMIQYVPESPDICMLALIKDYTCYRHISKPTIYMQQFVKELLDVDVGMKILLTF